MILSENLTSRQIVWNMVESLIQWKNLFVVHCRRSTPIYAFLLFLLILGHFCWKKKALLVFTVFLPLLRRLFISLLIDGKRSWFVTFLARNGWIYVACLFLTCDTKLRWFQYRLTHRILAVNSYLLKIGKRDNDLCSFCQAESETLLHLFCTCEVSILFWNLISDWLKNTLNIQMQLDNKTILFATTYYSRSVLNLILLLGRLHIHKMKMNGGLPSLGLFRDDLKRYYALGKFIFTTNGNSVKFNTRWDPSPYCLIN